MSTAEGLLQLVVVIALGSPALLLVALALGSLPRRKLGEATVARLTGAAMLTSITALAVALVVYVGASLKPSLWTARQWFSTDAGAFQLDLLVDEWALAFALVAAVISGTVGAFSFRYLHREPGFHRYFTLFACFVLGILLVSLAGSVEVLFAGWELLGLSSALLVAFFHERAAPVENAMRVFATYRVSDAAMLIAAVLLHHAMGSGSLSAIFLSGDAAPAATIPKGELTAISVFLVIAVAGKSALLPFSGWLPRAMEGPTPSSAVYYGALSVHAGCYLLWRAGPLLAQSTTAQVLAGAAGASTAIYATLMARVQTDAKSALCYATLTQVGIIVVEIALGLRLLPFIHMMGNACLRLVQFLSAPNVLQDLRGLEVLPSERSDRAGRPPRALGLYVASLEGFSVEAFIDRWVIGGFLGLARLGARMDRRLAGEAPEARVARKPREARDGGP